ncbi:MAG: hypothetical protein KUL75_00850, partial [Sterolibacterium sp.]|nr:hypothetical protein [Sterolibacterium sp.]
MNALTSHKAHFRHRLQQFLLAMALAFILVAGVRLIISPDIYTSLYFIGASVLLWAYRLNQQEKHHLAAIL